MQPYQLDSTDWIKQELAGLLGEQVTRDINDIIRLYSLYDGDGQRWQVETKGLDYTPTVKVTNIIAELIGKEARYMMGVEPELHIVPKEKDNHEIVHERMIARNSDRDTWKLAHWDEYIASCDFSIPKNLDDPKAKDDLILFKNNNEEEFETSMQNCLHILEETMKG